MMTQFVTDKSVETKDRSKFNNLQGYMTLIFIYCIFIGIRIIMD